jgi:ParB-like chromosome segregation protein Spo0J
MGTIRISINSINPEDKRYQVRDPRASTWGMKVHDKRSSEEHIKRLVRDLRNDLKLKVAPIEVTRDPKDDSKYIIVDGFHRYAAFKKINKETRGGRFKQIRCVFTENVPLERALSINTEHKAKGLNVDQMTELDWQNFLQLMVTDPSISIAETAKKIGVSKSTVSNWRKERKIFIENGYFEPTSRVEKNLITGFPILKQARDELRKDFYEDSDTETQGQLCESDKELLQTILKAVNKAKEPNKLKRGVDLFWGEKHNLVDYDANLDESEYDEF